MDEGTRSILYVTAIYVLFFVMIFTNYGSFVVTVRRWSKRPKMSPGSRKIPQPKLTIKEILPCYIPLYQVVLVQKTLRGEAKAAKIVSIICACGIFGNLFNKFVYGGNWFVMFIFNIAMLVSVLMFLLIYSIITMWCARLYDFSTPTVVLCFIVPFLWCWYLHNNIPAKMRTLYKEEVFNEHMGGTVIKQRSNK